MRPPVTIARLVRLALLAAPFACARGGLVTWEDERRVSGLAAAGATLSLTDAGTPVLHAAWVPVRWPDDSTACAGTQVGSLVHGDTAVAAWWSAAADAARPARLVVARSVDGGLTWQAPVAVGTSTPRSGACARPPPGLAVDSATGAVHVAFQGAAGAKAGIVTVSLARGALRGSSAVLVAPGAAPRFAAIAAQGDTVAVAFESPAAADGALWLAISLGSGHIPNVPRSVTPAGARAVGPIVALRGGRVAVAWNEPRRGADGPVAVVRVGRFNR